MTTNFTQQESMIIDPSEFNFFDLDDIKDIGVEGGFVSDDLMGVNKRKDERAELDEMFGEGEFATENDPMPLEEDEVGDLRPQEDDGTDGHASEYFQSLDDEATIDFGGVALSKAEVRELARAKSDITNKDSAISQYVQQFSEIDRKMDAAAAAARTETEEMYNAIQRKLNDPRTSDSERGRLYNDMRNLEVRYAQIQEGVARAEQARIERDNIDLSRRYDEVNRVMGSELGTQWNQEYARGVIDYALSSGITQEQIARNLSPSFIKMMIKAQKFDSNEKARNAKLNETMNSRNPRSKRSTNSPRGVNEGLNTAKRKAIEGFTKGTMTEKDMSNVFGLLED